MKKIKLFKFVSILSLASFLPMTASAALCTGVGSTLMANAKLGDVFNFITCLIGRSVVPLIFTLAVVMFMWGVVQFIMGAEEEAKRTKGKQFMLWGIVALFVMVSVWGLVRILGTTFGVNTNFVPQVNQQ